MSYGCWWSTEPHKQATTAVIHTTQIDVETATPEEWAAAKQQTIDAAAYPNLPGLYEAVEDISLRDARIVVADAFAQDAAAWRIRDKVFPCPPHVVEADPTVISRAKRVYAHNARDRARRSARIRSLLARPVVIATPSGRVRDERGRRPDGSSRAPRARRTRANAGSCHSGQSPGDPDEPAPPLGRPQLKRLPRNGRRP